MKQVRLGIIGMGNIGKYHADYLLHQKVSRAELVAVADAFALSEKFEEKLTQYAGNLPRAAVELAQDWRQDKAMRKLEAMLIAADADNLLIISGTGEVISPDDGICAIGSGGNYALAAARALAGNTDLTAHDIALKSLHIAASICVFTNDNIYVEDL